MHEAKQASERANAHANATTRTALAPKPRDGRGVGVGGVWRVWGVWGGAHPPVVKLGLHAFKEHEHIPRVVSGQYVLPGAPYNSERHSKQHLGSLQQERIPHPGGGLWGEGFAKEAKEPIRGEVTDVAAYGVEVRVYGFEFLLYQNIQRLEFKAKRKGREGKGRGGRGGWRGRGGREGRKEQ